MNLTQFHLEPDIMPLDSRGEELETNCKLNNTDSLYEIKAQCDLKLRLSGKAQIV